MRAKDVMTKNVVSVTTGHSVRHAAQIMIDHEVSGLPVLDGEGKLVGVVTEGDLMRRCELAPEPSDTTYLTGSQPEIARCYIQAHAWSVQDVMTSPAAFVAPGDTLASIAAVFLEKGIRRVPVVRDEQIVGIVSRRDLLRAIVQSPEAEYIVGDDRILISVLARLREAQELLGSLPQVSVHHGIISLGGEVRSQPVRDMIRVIAEGVRGAAGVEDLMSVASVNPMYADDSAIRSALSGMD